MTKAYDITTAMVPDEFINLEEPVSFLSNCKQHN